jgi:hypothetical protein
MVTLLDVAWGRAGLSAGSEWSVAAPQPCGRPYNPARRAMPEPLPARVPQGLKKTIKKISLLPLYA